MKSVSGDKKKVIPVTTIGKTASGRMVSTTRTVCTSKPGRPDQTERPAYSSHGGMQSSPRKGRRKAH